MGCRLDQRLAAAVVNTACWLEMVAEPCASVSTEQDYSPLFHDHHDNAGSVGIAVHASVRHRVVLVRVCVGLGWQRSSLFTVRPDG